MRKRNGTRKFIKLRKGTKNYSTRRNKNGGGLGTLARYFTSDGRLLEEFKKKIRDVIALRDLLDTPDSRLEVSQILGKIGDKVHELKMRKDATNQNYGILKRFVNDNNKRLSEILQNMDMQIEKRDFYLKVLEEVSRLGDAVVGDFSMESPAATPLPPAAPLPPDAPPARSLPLRPASLPVMSDGADSADDDAGADANQIILNRYKQLLTNPDDKKNLHLDENNKVVYVNSNLHCPTGNDDGLPETFTCGYIDEAIKDGKILDIAVCKLCYSPLKNHTEEPRAQGQGGGSRRRRRNTRKNKTKRNGKCRACRCPGGCKRSTCPCYRGRSKPCCTKRCKSRGRRCKC